VPRSTGIRHLGRTKIPVRVTILWAGAGRATPFVAMVVSGDIQQGANTLLGSCFVAFSSQIHARIDVLLVIYDALDDACHWNSGSLIKHGYLDIPLTGGTVG
jgi:hypothetical protein